MPSLTNADREALLGPRRPCFQCGVTAIRQYCRSCDVFFDECLCGPPAHAAHTGHRMYRWVDGRVIADPDFDFTERP